MATDDKVMDYIQGRLTPSDRDAFEAAIATDRDLAAEVAALTAARAALAQSDGVGPDQQGWTRLSQAIEAAPAIAPVANDNRPLRFSLLQVACVAVIAALGLQLAVTTFSPPGPDTGFQPVSARTELPSVQIVFATGAMAADITQMLSDLGGTIVDGPSALGLYTVAFPDITTLDNGFAALQGNPAIVDEVTKN